MIITILIMIIVIIQSKKSSNRLYFKGEPWLGLFLAAAPTSSSSAAGAPTMLVPSWITLLADVLGTTVVPFSPLNFGFFLLELTNRKKGTLY